MKYEWSAEYNQSKEHKFWMITGDGNQPKIRHTSKGLAVQEAERLAKANPGIKFYVLEAVEMCTVSDLVRVKL